MDQRQALLFGEPLNLLQAIGEGGTLLDDPGTILLGVRHLDEWGELWHHHSGSDAQPRGVVRHRLSVIPGAGRDHPLPLLVFAQLEKLVHGTPILEGSRPLQVLELPEEPAGKYLPEGLSGLAGGLDDPLPNPPPGGVDVSKAHHRSGPRGSTLRTPDSALKSAPALRGSGPPSVGYPIPGEPGSGRPSGLRVGPPEPAFPNSRTPADGFAPGCVPDDTPET